MHVEVGRSHERLPAVVACKRPLVGVHHHVLLGVTRVVTAKAADAAREHRHAVVHAHVTDEIVAAPDALATHVACDRVLAPVDMQVHLQLAVRCIHLAANAARITPRFGHRVMM